MERHTASKKDIILIAVLLLIAALMGSFFLLQQQEEGSVAALSIDGNMVELYDLSKESDRIIDLRESYAVPILLEIKDGAICFKESVCPDHLCENYGYISRVTETAVCMPNRCVLTIYSHKDHISLNS